MYKIIDDFLSPSESYRIENLFLSLNFPWFFGERVLSDGVLCKDLDNYQFAHLFYRDHKFTGQYHSILDPMIVKLKADALIKIKANLNPRTEKIIEHGYHKDFQLDCLTAVYYVNTNNGYTRFKNGDVVNSVRGRMLIFNSDEYHTGSTCTDQKCRSVINFNFFSEEQKNNLLMT